MRKLLRILQTSRKIEKTESKETYRTIAKDAYAKACLQVCTAHEIRFTELSKVALSQQLDDYIASLLRGTLIHLVAYFETQGVAVKEEKTILQLKAQLEDKTLLIDILSTLCKNLEAIPPGFFDRGCVYRTFTVILTLPKFAHSKILRHSQKENNALKNRVEDLEAQVEEFTKRQYVGEEETIDSNQTSQNLPSLFETVNVVDSQSTIITIDDTQTYAEGAAKNRVLKVAKNSAILWNTSKRPMEQKRDTLEKLRNANPAKKREEGDFADLEPLQTLV